MQGDYTGEEKWGDSGTWLNKAELLGVSTIRIRPDSESLRIATVGDIAVWVPNSGSHEMSIREFGLVAFVESVDEAIDGSGYRVWLSTILRNGEVEVLACPPINPDFQPHDHSLCADIDGYMDIAGLYGRFGSERGLS